MPPAFRLYNVTLDINTTAVDNDTLQDIVEQILKVLNDTDAPPPERSTTTVIQTIPTTVTVTDVRTSVVTATGTTARSVKIVPSTTFTVSDENQFGQTTSTEATLSTVLSPTTSTVSSSTSSTDVSPTASALANLAVNKSLPPAAIVGIVFACMLLFLLPVIFYIRRRLRRKRKKRRSWVTPFVAEKPVVRASLAQRQDKRKEFLAERWQRMLGSQRVRRDREAANEDGSPSGPNDVANHTNRDDGRVDVPPSAYRGPSACRPVKDALLVSNLFPNGAVAKLKFEPRKQDELSVCPGDYLKVLMLFDDGWARCRDKSGKKGMVPTSCLRTNRAGRIRKE
ncbi:hypothetical protein AGABI2DRAFT_114861 [Agaricus bisporus var. bisporus H97]|uniref:hypothetical protein n=1 Tax=Agaricus bisporus var. bisporus (strain H97 / ATCC MYA-4626 / FGSC 10389) TaxID=936046 RepID=UPI00029F79AD|nr:hypothetical protein AGABI2DRAFT_114861 [Agaricus bisporus var. bisporus H97]EKV49785.1 hypothetical protein AGABI2DRAFT_114861 [Agaricus bisporus var. bisporus H97]